MDLNSVYYNTDPNTSYTIYDLNGQYGAVPSSETPPEGSTVVFSNISGKTIQKDVRNEQKDLWNSSSQGRDNAQEQEQQMSEQYYSYLTNGASSSGNLCMA